MPNAASRLIEGRVHGGAVDDVCGDGEGLTTAAADVRNQIVDLLLAARDADDARTVGREDLREAAPEARRGAGDKRHRAVEGEQVGCLHRNVLCLPGAILAAKSNPSITAAK